MTLRSLTELNIYFEFLNIQIMVEIHDTIYLRSFSNASIILDF